MANVDGYVEYFKLCVTMTTHFVSAAAGVWNFVLDCSAHSPCFGSSRGWSLCWTAGHYQRPPPCRNRDRCRAEPAARDTATREHTAKDCQHGNTPPTTVHRGLHRRQWSTGDYTDEQRSVTVVAAGAFSISSSARNCGQRHREKGDLHCRDQTFTSFR